MSIFPSNNYYLIITLLSIVALLHTLPISTSTNDTSDIDPASHHQLSDALHDLLSENGFPKGLVPDAVESYTLASDGTFRIRLKTSTCYVKFTDLFHYDRTIAGKLSYGRISGLSGIQVKKSFAWLSITDMVVDGQAIELLVSGFLSEKFPVGMFKTIPSCQNTGGRKGLLAHQQLAIARETTNPLPRIDSATRSTVKKQLREEIESFKSGFRRHPGAIHGGDVRCAQGGAKKTFITWVGTPQV